MKAAAAGHLAVVQTLLTAGADAGLRGPYDTALDVAAEHGHIGVLRALLGHGADVNGASESEGCTALHVAAQQDQAGVIDVLIEAGADAGRRDRYEQTPFGFAATESACRAMRALLRHGANPNVRDCRKRTPLHAVCDKQSTLTEAVDLLLRCGLDETAVDWDDMTPADLLNARRRGRWCSLGEIDRANLLLERAPIDRAWRRRGWLVMLVSLTLKRRPAGCTIVGVDGHGSIAVDGRGESEASEMARNEDVGGGDIDVLSDAVNRGVVSDEGFRAVVESLIGLELEGVFRFVVGFL